MEIIINEKGEGMVLRKPEGLYEHGRSKNTVKLKVHRDREALVLGVEENELLLQLPNGITFTAPSSLSKIPKIGEIVSFIYSGFDSSSSHPLSPVVHRIRSDLSSWHQNENISSISSLSPSKVNLTEKALKQRKNMSNPSGHWTNNENYNMRQFVDNYAKKYNFDPLDPLNWYSISRLQFVKEPGAGSVLAHYNSSLIRCLQDLYPSVEFDESKFKKKTSQYWHSSANRRRFLEEFAKDNNFDPLVPHNWYLYTRKDLDRAGGSTFLNCYKGSFIKAIVDLFPEIKFDEIKFKRTKSRYWQDKENRKRFLENFAEKRGFKITDVARWYTVTQDDILKEKGGISLLNQYGMSMRKALLDLYPSIDSWALHNFRQKHVHSNPELTEYNTNKTKLRSYFDTLARKLAFDPLVASNWYSLSKQNLKSNQVGIYILQRYYGSVASAVTDAYPELQFDLKKFYKRNS